MLTATTQKGIQSGISAEGVRVIRIHYSADPLKDPDTPSGAKWLKRELQGYRGKTDPRWRKEMEIDFDTHGGQLLFPYLLENEHSIFVNPYTVKGLTLSAGLDYGTRNPSAFEVLAVDYDGNIQVIWEYYEQPKEPKETDEQFRARKGYKALSKAIKSCPYFSSNLVIYADPSLWNKTQESADPKGIKSMADMFVQEGVFLTQGQRGRDFTCYEKLNAKSWKNPAKPKLTIMKTCKWLWWELQRLRFSDYSPTVMATKNLQEKIIDKDNHCYSKDTDILVEGGWKRFYELGADDRVATWGGDDGLIVWEKPKEILEYDYRGAMCSFESNKLSFCVTPNHHMWVASQSDVIRRKAPAYKRRIISEVDEDMWVCKAGRTQNSRIDWPDNKIAWYGFWLAAGCSGAFSAHIDQKFADEEVVTMLNDAGQHSIRENGDTGGVRYSFGVKFYDLVKDQGRSYEKFIPPVLKNGSVEQLRLLIYWMVRGAGIPNDTMWRYNTSSLSLANDFQEICFLCGYVTRLSVQAERESILPNGKQVHGRTMYHVSVQKGGNGDRSVLARIKKKQILQTEYDGKIYCVNTNSGVVAVRHNGIPMWCGQSWDSLKYAIMQIPQFTDMPAIKLASHDRRIDTLARGQTSFGDYAHEQLRRSPEDGYNLGTMEGYDDSKLYNTI